MHAAQRRSTRRLDKLDEIYQLMLPKVIAEYDDETVKTKEDLQKWGRRLRGKDKSFTLDGVRMELANGETIAVPLFLFSLTNENFLNRDGRHGSLRKQKTPPGGVKNS